MSKEKTKRGDRYDGYRVHETDAMHAFMPYLMPNRADNEAVLNENFDLTALSEYIKKKNEESGDDFKYTFFHAIVAALAKTIVLRPKMNRFYAGNRLYDRKEISFSFTVKIKFDDNSDEALAIVNVDKDSDIPPIEQIHGKVKEIVTGIRKENKIDGATDKMGILLHLPRPILKLTMKFLKFLDYHGLYPKSFAAVDPYYTSVFVSNLGSIKMHASYHHLANWGTNSFFVVIDEKKFTPVFNDNGSFEMRETLDMGLTIDERIADGYYFAGSMKIFRKLIQNPELLDRPITEAVEL